MNKKMYRHLMTGVSQSFIILLIGSTLLAIGSALNNTNIRLEYLTLLSTVGHQLLLLVFPVMGYGISKSIYSNNAGIISLVVLLVSKEPSMIFTLIIAFTIPIFVKLLDQYSQRFELPIVRTILIPALYGLVILISIIGVKPVFVYVDNIVLAILSNKIMRGLLMFSIAIGVIWDLGGPVNKTTSMIANALYVQGLTQAAVVKMTSGMVAPVGIGLALLISSQKGGMKLVIDGLCFYNESLMPYQQQNRRRVIISSVLGVITTALLIVVLDVDGYAIQGGFITALTYKPLTSYLLSLFVGVIVTMITYLVFGLSKNENVIEKEEEFSLEKYLEEKE